jgi:hypothetical protein
LLLLAAAHETGLLEALERAVPVVQAGPTSRLAHSTRTSRRRLLLTLLFLGLVGLRRTWDLRGYTGAGLALLTGRKRAYGYRHVERFLSEVAQAGGAETLTDALAAWTARLWKPTAEDGDPTVPAFFLDGHRKPVFSDCLLPRGVIGRTGKILGCRALLLLHDDQGHPLLATTQRGDLHLTLGAPSLMRRYEAATDEVSLRRLVIDREGMAAEFLAKLAAERRWVVTILRTEQYRGLASFTDVGAFLPLARDRTGQVTREVAPAHFQLPLPEQPGHFLPLTVALIRDWRAQVPVPPTAEDRPAYRWPPNDAQGRGWWLEEWEPTPTASTPTEPKLIPIVTTALDADPVELAHLYRQRWPVQENILKDWLLPLGLDTNHGFAKTPVENSEVAKRREAIERRLANIQRWAPKAHKRAEQAARLSERLRQETKAHSDALYREINRYICEHDLGNEREWRLQHKPVVKAMQAEADADLDARWRRYERVRDRQEQEASKRTRYRLEQCDLLGALAELSAKEREMFELENGKDQCMTSLKLALANLGMWARDQYFPATYAHATWPRLAPFFRVPGRVTEGPQRVMVELHPFNDRQLTRDLSVVCERVATAQPHLPDGRQLCFTIVGTRPLIPNGAQGKVACTSGVSPFGAGGPGIPGSLGRRAAPHLVLARQDEVGLWQT